MSWEDGMRITVLTVPECPNAPLAMERVTTALACRAAQVELVEVHDQVQAAELGMNGSPTILLDGVDPFASSGAVPSLSCRLYRDADGTVTGAPNVAALREALTGAGLEEATAAGDCCAPNALDVVGRAGRGRRAPAKGGLRVLHQKVLRHFADTGAAPAPEVMEPIAAQAGRTAGQVLAELAAEDFVTLDEAGEIRAAYPFSATPTRHRVRIDGGTEVWSMCAIDALGIPAMLDVDVVISSTDPVTGKPVTVTTQHGATVWDPQEAVVFVGQRPGGGPAATACCDALNFFTSAASAHAWAADHPGLPGRVIDQAAAEDIARQTFGPLLAP
ncbi:alkylmercury lyase family protein [Streptomyces sp. NPDC056527]|uniref:alkylmercury lyase family protein n=1 Tax=Streptomyces sp. NPDC056527 TaxID=3345853 RepID=UPI0036BD656B